MTQPQAPMDTIDGGLVPTGPGWFIVNGADAAWRRRRGRRSAWFENRDGLSFPEIGLNLVLLDPDEPNGKYHGEAGQEAFLVLQGEGILVIEEQEVPVGAWDFVHVPAWTNHIFVGAGDEPCAILMVGARPDVPDDESIVYPVSEMAARHGASVDQETRDVPTAYSDWPGPEAIPSPWPPPDSRRQAPRRPRRGSPDASGWYVQHVADAHWMRDTGGAFAGLTHGKEHFTQLGMNLTVLDPDQAVCRYHEESVQEDFIVLAGEARAIVEDQEIRMRAWDLLHCPAGTRHVLAGTETGGGVVLMIGSRAEGTVLYPRNELAGRYGGSVEADTTEPPVAYTGWQQPEDIAASWPPPDVS